MLVRHTFTLEPLAHLHLFSVLVHSAFILKLYHKVTSLE